MMLALGGDGPGMLREWAIFDENVLVKLPKHFSWGEESRGISRSFCFDGLTNERCTCKASAITCAGVTAWTALNHLSELHSKLYSKVKEYIGGSGQGSLFVHSGMATAAS